MGRLTTKQERIMKKKFIAFASIALALVGCVKNEIENPQPAGIKYLEVSTPATKTTLDEDGLTLLWKNGDKIKVNNHNSIGLQAEKNKGTSAEFGFTAAEKPEAPYYAVYNATRAYGYGEQGGPHTYKLSLDYNNYTQKWYENSFDPEYSVLYCKSETENIVFNHAMSYIKITPTLGEENVNIARIDVIAKNGEIVSGRMIIDTETGNLTPYRDNKSYVTMAGPAEGVALGKSFLIAIPPQEYASGLKIRIVDVNGNMMEKSTKAITTERGKVHSNSVEYAHTAVAPALATAAEVSSSTANFTWTLGKDAATDVAKAWTIQCSASSDFADATEYTIPEGKGADVWNNITPKFCFGGLEQATTYYFRVKSGEDGLWSEVVSATTATYDKKTVVTENAQEGDVILAEDFAASAVSAEVATKAAGVTDGTFKKYTDSFTVANASSSYIPAALKNWGFARGTGSANLYANQGHLKLGTGSAQSYLVTPELAAIPENKVATLEVTLTLAVYPDDASRVTKFIVSSESGSMSATNLFTCDAPFLNKVEANLASSSDDRKKWATYTVQLPKVMQGQRLMIAASNNAGNNRLLINDVKAKIVALEDYVDLPTATATEVSSSTVSFTWGYATATAAEDANRKYEFGLYKDAACSQLVVSYKTDANQACWKSRKPKFCFGCLEPNTTYYFKVKDVDADRESEVVSSKTSEFTIKTMPTSAASEGDIILAEDFSEIFLGGEPVIGAAAACTKYAEANVFETLSGEFPTCVYNADSDEKALTNDTALSGKRLEKWSYAFNSGSSIYAHVGCVKLGTGSNNTWLTTPVLSAIPDGKKADLEITVTLAAWSGATTTGFVYAGNIADKASITAATNVVKSSSLATVVGAWNTYKVTLTGVDNTMRLAIGPDNDTAKTAKGKGRMVVNDVVVKIKALK